MRKLLWMSLLLMLGTSAAASACSCRIMSLESQLTQSTAVFVGRVEAVDGWQRRARLLVTAHIKGRFATASTVDVHADDRTTCAATVDESAELLVFLDEVASGDPSISFCNAFLARTLELP